MASLDIPLAAREVKEEFNQRQRAISGRRQANVCENTTVEGWALIESAVRRRMLYTLGAVFNVYK